MGCRLSRETDHTDVPVTASGTPLGKIVSRGTPSGTSSVGGRALCVRGFRAYACRLIGFIPGAPLTTELSGLALLILGMRARIAIWHERAARPRLRFVYAQRGQPGARRPLRLRPIAAPQVDRDEHRANADTLDGSSGLVRAERRAAIRRRRLMAATQCADRGSVRPRSAAREQTR